MESHGHSCINLPAIIPVAIELPAFCPEHWVPAVREEEWRVGEESTTKIILKNFTISYASETRNWPGQYVKPLACVCETSAFERRNTHPSFRRTFSLKLLHSVSFKLWLQTHPSRNRKHLSSSFLTRAHHSPFAGTHSFCWQSSITRKSSVSKADLK